MKKRTKVLMIATAAALVLGTTAAVAGPVIYRDFFAPTAANKPGLSPDLTDATGETGAEGDQPGTSSTEPLSPDQIAGIWKVMDGSEAGYRVNEVLNGTNVTVTGRTSKVEGSLIVSEDGLTLETAEFIVDVASIATDSSSRDSYFRDQALNTSQHPEAHFALTFPVSVDALPQSGEVVELEAAGDLTIAGVTQSVPVELQVRSDGETTGIAGSIPVTFQDYGVAAPSLGFVKVEPTGFVELQLIATRE